MAIENIPISDYSCFTCRWF